MKIYREFNSDVDDLERNILVSIPCGYVDFDVNFVTGEVSWKLVRNGECSFKQKDLEH